MTEEWRIPLSDIDLGETEVAAAAEVIRSRWLTMGPLTRRFEEAFAARHRTPHAIALSSCTAALHLAYAALDLASGDEVVMPALTFVATANAVVLCGARPVFADIVGADDPTIDPGHVKGLISPRTRAVVAVHYAGYPCHMEELARLSREHNLALIEDCAHAPGLAYEGRHLGTWGRAGCFSFFSNKNMTTGEGGMLTTSDAALADRVRKLRSHGMTSGTWQRHHGRPRDYDVLEVGWNYRIDEIRAAIGLVQLDKLEAATARRLELARLYRRSLEGLPGITMPFAARPEPTAAHILPILASTADARQRVVHALAEAGVQSSHHYPPVHLFRHYRERFGYKQGALRRTEAFAAREITLPLYPALREADVEYVVRAIRNALSEPTGYAERSLRDPRVER